MPFLRLRFKINAAITATCLFVALFFGVIVYPYEMNRRTARFEEIQTLDGVRDTFTMIAFKAFT